MNNFLKSHLNILSKKFSNPDLELRVLLNKCSINKKDIIFSNFDINNIDLKNFSVAFNRRLKREPISKIYNSKSFWKYNFYVNKNVLDPRPETELIIEKVLENFPNKKDNFKILDLCTGSGCLAISLAKEYLNSEITATDISLKALNVAKKNANMINCINQIKFVKSNLIDKIEKYDIVVSNPPYLSMQEYEKTSPEILKYEPKIALLASRGGYEFYWKISNFLKNILKDNSKAFIEIGSTQVKKVTNIFASRHINCLKVEKDIQNIDRLLILNKS